MHVGREEVRDQQSCFGQQEKSVAGHRILLSVKASRRLFLGKSFSSVILSTCFAVASAYETRCAVDLVFSRTCLHAATTATTATTCLNAVQVIT